MRIELEDYEIEEIVLKAIHRHSKRASYVADYPNWYGVSLSGMEGSKLSGWAAFVADHAKHLAKKMNRKEE